MKKYIISALVTAILALGGWGGLTFVSHAERLASAESQLRSMENWLWRVENKLDRVLERR